jgi:hypothetical protein
MTDDDDDRDDDRAPTTALKPWERGGPSPNPRGRGKGNLNKWSRETIENAFRHFREHPEALDRLYEENIVAYVKTIFDLIPKDMRIQLVRPLEAMSDEELALLAEQEHMQTAKLIEHVKEKVGADIVETAVREVMDEEE